MKLQKLINKHFYLFNFLLLKPQTEIAKYEFIHELPITQK